MQASFSSHPAMWANREHKSTARSRLINGTSVEGRELRKSLPCRAVFSTPLTERQRRRQVPEPSLIIPNGKQTARGHTFLRWLMCAGDLCVKDGDGVPASQV